jgi:four helix bundle protein
LNYGEAQAAESRKDFIHKLRIVQKELRETKVCLTLLLRAGLVKNESLSQKAKKECSELIAIITSSITTSQKGLSNNG